MILPIRRIEKESLQFGHGGVIADGRYIESSGIEGRVGGYYSWEKEVVSDETVVYCGYLIKQWGYFLIESIARLWFFFDGSQEIDSYIFVVKENDIGELKGNYREFMELLGIVDKIKIINQPTRFKKSICTRISL